MTSNASEPAGMVSWHMAYSYCMVQNCDGENTDEFSEFIGFPIKIFHFITDNDLSVIYHSRLQSMKYHRNVTAPCHTSISPSLDYIVTLICIATKTATMIFNLFCTFQLLPLSCMHSFTAFIMCILCISAVTLVTLS